MALIHNFNYLGTPWCVVWTGDGRVFFYNPSTRTSVWERPDDLALRGDVDKMVSSPPDAVVNANSGLAATTTTTTTSTTSPPVSTADKREKDDAMESSDEDEGTPAKKPKIENSKSELGHQIHFLKRMTFFF